MPKRTKRVVGSIMSAKSIGPLSFSMHCLPVNFKWFTTSLQKKIDKYKPFSPQHEPNVRALSCSFDTGMVWLTTNLDTDKWHQIDTIKLFVLVEVDDAKG